MLVVQLLLMGQSPQAARVTVRRILEVPTDAYLRAFMAKHGAEKWVIDFSPPLTPVKTRMGRSASVSNHIPDGALNKNIASAKGEDFEALCAEMA